jgi:DNA-binding transcriptional LysR family regulator
MTGQIERIGVFIRVAELESFAKAARDLGVSRSIVTRYVGELEDDLGVQLLVRTTRKVSLTIAGQVYLDRVRPVVADLQRARELVKQQQDTLHGDLRVSVPISFGLRFLPDILDNFATAYPEVRIKIDMTDRFVDLIDEGYDMALRISGPPAGVSNIWRKITTVPRLLVASPGYLENHGRPEEPSDLANHAFLGYSHYAGGDALHLENTATGKDVVVPLRQDFQANSGELIVAHAVRGWGITLMPAFLVSEELRQGKLVTLLDGWSAPEIWLTAFYPPYDRLPAKVAAFTSFIEDGLAGRPQ